MDYNNINEFGQFTVDRWWSANSEDRSQLRSLFIMTTGLGGEAGEVLEKLKKYVRDGELDKEKLKKELGDVLYYLCRIAREFDMQPSEVVQSVVEKVIGREQRGTRRGSGDDR